MTRSVGATPKSRADNVRPAASAPAEPEHDPRAPQAAGRLRARAARSRSAAHRESPASRSRASGGRPNPRRARTGRARPGAARPPRMPREHATANRGTASAAATASFSAITSGAGLPGVELASDARDRRGRAPGVAPVADDDVLRPVIRLAVRHVEVQAGGGQLPIPRVAGDAHDAQPGIVVRRLRERDLEPLADRLLCRPVAASEGLADDDDSWPPFAVPVVECATPAQWDPQHPEVVGRDRLEVHERIALRLGRRLALDRERPVHADGPPQGPQRDGCRRLDAGQSPETTQEPVDVRALLLGLRVRRFGGAGLGSQRRSRGRTRAARPAAPGSSGPGERRRSAARARDRPRPPRGLPGSGRGTRSTGERRRAAPRGASVGAPR